MARPAKYDDEKTLRAAIQRYFNACRHKGEVPNKAGLCLALGISRETWSNYREPFLDAIKEAENTIENAWVQRLAGTTPKIPRFGSKIGWLLRRMVKTRRKAR